MLGPRFRSQISIVGHEALRELSACFDAVAMSLARIVRRDMAMFCSPSPGLSASRATRPFTWGMRTPLRSCQSLAEIAAVTRKRASKPSSPGGWAHRSTQTYLACVSSEPMSRRRLTRRAFPWPDIEHPGASRRCSTSRARSCSFRETACARCQPTGSAATRRSS